ncbi:MAG: Trp family transcriptional regulator [Patescibacteria group bacterium]
MDKEKSIILPPISNYASRKEWETACWRKILESKELLPLLITSHERRDLIMRAAAMEGLISGKSYRKIGKELWVSPQTISVIKKAIDEKAYRSYLERSHKERKRRKYSPSPIPEKSKSKPYGRPRRTKYGTIYMPY